MLLETMDGNPSQTESSKNTPKSDTDSRVFRVKFKHGIALFSECDRELFEKYRWSTHTGRAHGKDTDPYVVRRHGGKKIKFHNDLMQPPPGLMVDHKNGKTLDNTRGNLRVGTQLLNALNRQKSLGCTSMYKGVSFDPKAKKNKWVAKFCKKRIGAFETEREAADAYDAALRERFGDIEIRNNAWIRQQKQNGE